jgi:hypothetical protein
MCATEQVFHRATFGLYQRRLYVACFRGLKFLSAVPPFPAIPWIDRLNGAQCHFAT